MGHNSRHNGGVGTAELHHAGLCLAARRSGLNNVLLSARASGGLNLLSLHELQATAASGLFSKVRGLDAGGGQALTKHLLEVQLQLLLDVSGLLALLALLFLLLLHLLHFGDHLGLAQLRLGFVDESGSLLQLSRLLGRELRRFARAFLNTVARGNTAAREFLNLRNWSSARAMGLVQAAARVHGVDILRWSHCARAGRGTSARARVDNFRLMVLGGSAGADLHLQAAARVFSIHGDCVGRWSGGSKRSDRYDADSRAAAWCANSAHSSRLAARI